MASYCTQDARALELLEELKPQYRRGLITNVPSNLSRDFVLDILSKTGLMPFFGHILVSSEMEFNKPDPRIFEIMLQILKSKPEETIMVEYNCHRYLRGKSNRNEDSTTST